MNSTTIAVIVALALLVLAFFTYLHKKHVRFNKEDLTLKAKGIFDDAGTDMVDETDFVFALKEQYDCSRKEALYLFGKACEKGIVKGEDKKVCLV